MHFRMDWKSIRFDWNRARAFLVTAEEGSFSAAAKALNMTQPTLGRQVDALEQELGVTLFDRVGRGLVLTPSGQQLIEHVRTMAEAASNMSLSASGQAQDISGTVSISASEIYTTTLLPPIIARLRRLYPSITLEIVPSNDAVDLRKREADIAIRNFRPEQNDLITRKLRDDRGYFYATPDYLASVGNPTTAKDLSRVEFIGFSAGTDIQMIAEMAKHGIAINSGQFRILAGDHNVHWALVKEGAGVGVVPAATGDAEQSVVRVVPDAMPMVFPIWLTTHRELKTSRRIRLVWDVLADEISKR